MDAQGNRFEKAVCPPLGLRLRHVAGFYGRQSPAKSGKLFEELLFRLIAIVHRAALPKQGGWRQCSRNPHMIRETPAGANPAGTTRVRGSRDSASRAARGVQSKTTPRIDSPASTAALRDGC